MATPELRPCTRGRWPHGFRRQTAAHIPSYCCMTQSRATPVDVRSPSRLKKKQTRLRLSSRSLALRRTETASTDKVQSEDVGNRGRNAFGKPSLTSLP